jgi:hypothetical protein
MLDDASGPSASVAVWPADLQELPEAKINFAKRLELIGIEFEQEHDRLVLRLGWRLLTRIGAPLRCFAHVTDAAGVKIDSLDHELLGGYPPLSEWQAGDQAYERLYLQLTDAFPRRLQLRLGVYEPASNLRWPIWASSLPVTNDYTAAMLGLGELPCRVEQYRFGDALVEACSIIFDKGVHLSGYAVSRADSAVWLQLQWVLCRPPNLHWRFFGHGIVERSPLSPILVSFDQDLALRWAHPMQGLEQNLGRSVRGLKTEPRELGAGIFHVRSGRRLRVLQSSLPFDPESQRVFLSLGARSSAE